MLSENLHMAIPAWLGPWWWLPLLLAGLALAVIVWRDPMRTGWRVLPFIFLLLGIYPPERLIEEKISTSPTALIIKDLSLSQQMTGQADKVEQLANDLHKKLSDLQNVQVEEITIDGASDPAHTNIWQAYQNFSVRIPYEQQAGIFLISDGQIHDLPAQIPKELPPWHVLLTGLTQGVDDQLQIIHAPPYALQNKPYQLTVKVVQQNGITSPAAIAKTLPLNITLSNGTIQRFDLEPDKPTKITLQLPQTGAQSLLLSIPTATADVAPANNHALVQLHVQRTQLNVLLLSGAPTLNTRLWRDVLKREPQINLAHFIILRDAAHQAAEDDKDLALIPLPFDTLFDKTLPQFDMVILDDFAATPNFLPRYATALRNFVQNDGGLLVMDGPNSVGNNSLGSTALADIWPSEIASDSAENWRTKSFLPQPTVLGITHPVTANLLWPDPTPWQGQAILTPKAESQIWLKGADNLPLLLGNIAGKGRVAELASNELWRWARSADETPWFGLLQNLTAWLLQTPEMADPQITLMPDLKNVPPSLKVSVRSNTNNLPPIMWQAADMARQQLVGLNLQNGSAKKEFVLSQPGLYTAQLGDQFKAYIYNPGESPERDQLLATDQMVKPLVQASGGSIQAATEKLPALRWIPIGHHFAGTGWMGLRPGSANQVVGIYKIPLLPSWALLVLVLFALALAWWREGR